MDEKQQALALIEMIGAKPREWGQHIDALLKSLDALSNDDWCAVKRSASANARYTIMIQYLGHIERTYTDVAAPEAAQMVEGGVTLILLEGFELDYRETTLRVADFLNATGVTVTHFNRRAHECDSPALNYIRGLCQT